jgi:O-antigen ligase/tetratricopeptide (TPR) repeat protein
MKPASHSYPTDGIGRLAGFLFLALVPCVTLNPIARFQPVWLAQDMILRWVAVILFFLCFSTLLPRGKNIPSFRLDFPDLAFLFLSGWVLLSVKNSKEAFESFYAFRSFLVLALGWFSLRLLWDRWPGIYPVFEKVFIWTAGLSAAWLVLTTGGHGVGLSIITDQFIPRIGSFPNENIAAGFLGMAVIWGCLNRLHGGKFPLAALALIVLAWGLTLSRGGFISLGLIAVLYLLLHIRDVEKRLAKWGPAQWRVFGGGVLLTAVILYPMVNRVFHALEMDPRAGSRLELWKSGFQMAMTQPWFGFGPGTFADVYPSYRPGSLWNTLTPFAHNEYLQVAAECGLPALGLVLLFLWSLGRETGSGIFSTRPFTVYPSPVLAREAAFYILLLEAVHNFVDFTLHEWSHSLVLIAFVTYALREKSAPDDVRAEFHLSRRAFFGIVAVISFLLLWGMGVGGFRDYLARLYDYKSVVAQRAGNLEEAEALARGSLRFREDFMDPWNSLGAIEDARTLAASSPYEKEKHFRLADGYFRKAMQLSPYALTPRENEIQILIRRGKLDDALGLENQLIAKAPELPTNYVDLGVILLKMGRPKDVLTAVQKAIDLDRYYLPSYFLKAQAMEALGKRKDALLVYEEVRDMLNHLGLKDPSGQVEPNIRRLKAKP